MNAVENDSALRQRKEGILDYTRNWSKGENKISPAFMWARYCWVTWQINLLYFLKRKIHVRILTRVPTYLKTRFHILYTQRNTTHSPIYPPLEIFLTSKTI